ncbi:MAG: threonine/serine exporter ThrE family protein [Bacteroides sp.]
MTSEPHPCENPSLPEAGHFLAEYASWLLGCGATCIRIEKNVRRMAEALGLKADLIVMPSYVHVVLHKDGQSYNCLRKIHKGGISFRTNTLLSELSWALADKKCSYSAARQSFAQIQKLPPEPSLRVLMLVPIANASFCRLFGGDVLSMLLVYVATLGGYRLKQILLEAHIDVRLTFFCSAFFSAVIATAGHLFHLGSTPEVALGTSVLYLIPGIPYINSVSDLLDGHYLCAFSRFIDAAMLTACLSIGLCIGMLLVNLQWF